MSAREKIRELKLQLEELEIERDQYAEALYIAESKLSLVRVMEKMPESIHESFVASLTPVDDFESHDDFDNYVKSAALDFISEHQTFTGGTQIQESFNPAASIGSMPSSLERYGLGGSVLQNMQRYVGK